MLSPEEKARFFDVGFVVRAAVFTAPEVQRMRRAFDRLHATAGALGRSGNHEGAEFVIASSADGGVASPVRIERVVWCGAAEPELSCLGRDPRLLAMAAQLLGSNRMHQLINQAHFKMPGDGVEFPWHQDSVHRRYGGREWTDVNGRGSYVQTVTAVDDMTEQNGPLEFIPGSCRWGHLEPSADGDALDSRISTAQVETLSMKAGSVALFGPYTFHRSRPNRSDRPRRVFINGFAYPGANSRRYPGRGAGRSLVSGDFARIGYHR